MKNLLFLLLLSVVLAPAFAQRFQPADSTAVNALPVLRSYVAPNVVAQAKKRYGRSLYCIERAKREACEDAYLVGLINNGKLTIDWMCQDIKVAMLIDKRSSSY